ncbi:hypothetical protein RLEG12_01655 (plasmid) [Rhizobium leguminosarum bv. trifolii CB782]|nr:hypothetical protein RLEG12_01655 [Rhizobium leguminosarum bv. trifolii CB782]
MGKIWQKITYYCHRSELFALRLALRVPLLAPLLTGAMLHFWWCVAPLPILIPVVLVSENLGPLGPMVAGMSALAMLFFALPWFSGWCSIAAGVMFGRTAAARAKEEALAGAIRAYSV